MHGSRKYTVIAVDPLDGERVTDHVEAENPKEAERAFHMLRPTAFLVAGVVEGHVYTMDDIY